MNRFFLRGVGTLAILGFFLAALSCAHDQQLVAISIERLPKLSARRTFPCPLMLVCKCSCVLLDTTSIPQ